MARTKTASTGMKLVETPYWGPVEVPESTSVGANCSLSGTMQLGMNCRLGDSVTLEGGTKLGYDVSVGTATEIQRNSAVGNNVGIGANCRLTGVVVEDNVRIGSGVEISHGTEVRKGVKIPSNWKIPENCIVNPGVDGFPVVIPKPQSFHCNVRGTLSTGHGY